MPDNPYQQIVNCTIGKHTVVRTFVNLYGCSIGEHSMIGAFVEVQKGAVIGNKVRVQSHSFICEGVTIEDHVFIGHHVVFINDKYPRATNSKGQIISPKDWKLLLTVVKYGASIGSNATILGGVTIGRKSMIGAGSVVTKSIPDFAIAVGNPAKIVGYVNEKK